MDRKAQFRSIMRRHRLRPAEAAELLGLSIQSIYSYRSRARNTRVPTEANIALLTLKLADRKPPQRAARNRTAKELMT